MSLSMPRGRTKSPWVTSSLLSWSLTVSPFLSVIFFGLNSNRLAVMTMTRGPSSARARGLAVASSPAITTSPPPAMRNIPLRVNADSFRSERGRLQQLVEALGARVLVHRQLYVLDRHRVHARRSPLRLVHDPKPEILEGLILVEGYRLLLLDLVGVRKGEAQRAGGAVLRVPHGVVVLAMDVAVQHGHVLVGREEVHGLVAVRGEPLPVGPEVEERPVGEDHDRRRLREAGQVLGQPRPLLGTDLGPGPRDVVEGDEVHTSVVEGVVRRTEHVAVQLSGVQPRVVLARDVVDLRHLQPARDLPEEIHPRGVLARLLGVMGEVAG